MSYIDPAVPIFFWLHLSAPFCTRISFFLFLRLLKQYPYPHLHYTRHTKSREAKGRYNGRGDNLQVSMRLWLTWGGRNDYTSQKRVIWTNKIKSVRFKTLVILWYFLSIFCLSSIYLLFIFYLRWWVRYMYRSQEFPAPFIRTRLFLLAALCLQTSFPLNANSKKE